MKESGLSFLRAELAQKPTNAQRLFLLYYNGILVDLVVLNLFAEYSGKVVISSFAVSLCAAVLLQLLLKLTIAVEHRVAAFFKQRRGGLAKFLRYFCAWLVLFGSKFAILEAINFVFASDVRFLGAWHGVLTLIVVVVVMLLAEEAVVRFYRRLRSRDQPSAGD
ncbi:hypothetical protein PVT68_14490 [Microbulbifer bruguierae]|uniref:Uncharacterized protein n=1 Tax=Microbulbifer bruguierae TaxID=3029061 RepID=A0ABY8NBL3_9GAMM|nr:hypothetical protein [Microbulbifer bruguierae]WGL15972.1 hypothetical protein PVT68_14490 [Microbulbifer bruguierae]